MSKHGREFNEVKKEVDAKLKVKYGDKARLLTPAELLDYATTAASKVVTDIPNKLEDLDIEPEQMSFILATSTLLCADFSDMLIHLVFNEQE